MYISGDQVVMYSDLKYQNPVTDVDYHPRDHMIAFCSLGENHPVLLYSYDVQGNAVVLSLNGPRCEKICLRGIANNTGADQDAQSDQRLCYSLFRKYHMKTCFR